MRFVTSSSVRLEGDVDLEATVAAIPEHFRTKGMFFARYVAALGEEWEVLLPSLLERYAISAAMVLLFVGMGVGLLPMPEGLSLDPIAVRPQIQHVTELTVLVALMGVGLAIDRPLNLRRPRAWTSWSPTWRLLAVAMPLTIAATWGLGIALGVAPAAALLLASSLSPTDPVLASDVQVEGPKVQRSADHDPLDEATIDEEDDVRFALTSEAGLNDGTAFPFVHAAIFLAAGTAGTAAASGSVASWLPRWLAWELVGKIALGVAVGLAVGWVLGKVAFNATQRSLRLAEQGEPLLAIAALVATYGLSEIVGGYGFLAVFVCGVTIRAGERSSAYHDLMHGVVQRLERLLTLMILLVLGMALTNGLLAEVDARSIVIALALVFVVRPVAGWISLGLLPRVRRGRAPLRRGTMDVVDHRPDDPRLGRRARRPLDARDAPARREAPNGSVLSLPLSRSGARHRRR